jgi:hypothetical protein
MARAGTYGANSYGVPFKKWAAMSAKEKHNFRRRLYRQRLKELDPEKLKELSRRAYQRSRSTPEKIERYRAWYKAWSTANNDRRNAANRAYCARLKVKSVIVMNPDAIYRDIVKAIPRGWQKSLRDDIAGMVCLDILEGRAKLGDMDKLVKDAYRRFNKLMDTWSTLSLDAPIPGHDKGTYIDRLADPSTMQEANHG